ncbi:MAG: glycoside hydrolase family 43 protein [Bacteroidales bacterium]
MKHQSFVFLSLVFILFSCSNKSNEHSQNEAYFKYVSYQGDDTFYKEHPLKEGQYYNPVLQGYYPDPSVCKRGEYFYLVTSTFSNFPGLPIFRSTDLINWDQIGNALDRPEQFDNTDKRTSQGIYAPTIRYNKHEDMFYLVTTYVGGGGNFMLKAKDPAGPWSNPIWLPEVLGIDPDLFFDNDGRLYIANNQDPEGGGLYQGHKAIWLQEFDMKTEKTIGERKMIRNGGNNLDEKPIWIEGPHLYKMDGYYYLLTSEGGTSINHSLCFYRSKDVWGPYEACPSNPVLTQRSLDPNREDPVSNAGHADIVQMNDGSWRVVFLACRPYTAANDFNIGRETFMLPFEWRGGWPYFMEKNEQIPLIVDGLGSGKADANFEWKEEFAKKEIPMNWMFLRIPSSEWWRFPQDKNGIVIEAQATNLREQNQSAFLMVRQQHHEFSLETELTFNPTREDKFAGLAMLQNEVHFITFGLTQRDAKICVVVNQSTEQTNTKRIPVDMGIESIIGQKQLASMMLASGENIKLRIVCKDAHFSFYANDMLVVDGVDARHLSTEQAGGFIGTLLGVYVSTND